MKCEFCGSDNVLKLPFDKVAVGGSYFNASLDYYACRACGKVTVA